MESSSKQLADRFREVILHGTFIANTNYRQELQGLSLSIANAKVGTLNTIATIAQHINYYVEGVLKVFDFRTLDIKDKFSFDFKPLTVQSDWDGFLNRFWNNCEQLALHFEKLNNEELDNVFVEEKYGSYLRNLEGMIEHCYYHLGQIVLLKKLAVSQ
ncbi:DUF1572 domain-containing protein [Sphingobacterium hungaricum]|uniref:DUF1572 domain-containing protein n=1 Tax=Sphingobacterium hungaricum TaxID=2082723 RepID=A0A928UXE4_9SPHI|nr:DUF1572 domain-containing protein [Sphingobacterium hungaricum]MBE8712869.1 DUF1572 domain-containing protein [Sphingobacterium hungaricum]